MNDCPRHAEVTSEEFYMDEAESAQYKKEYEQWLDKCFNQPVICHNRLVDHLERKCPECGSTYKGEFHCGFYFPLDLESL
jgi:hypothetical protein